MYAVIRTGGKQYRVSPGDLLVVERLDGQPGDELRFDSVLMAGDGDGVTVGAPLVDGAAVSAVLIETRKGEKIKVFKKIRRQGYRRTKGHRQMETVLRVTGVDAGGGKTENWDGKVDLTTRAELNLRARGLAKRDDAIRSIPGEGVSAEPVVVDQDGGPVIEATIVEHYAPDTELSTEAATETAKPKRARKAAAPAEPTSAEGALIEEPISETPAEAPQTLADADAQDGVGTQEGTPKKTRARKSATADDAADTNEG